MGVRGGTTPGNLAFKSNSPSLLFISNMLFTFLSLRKCKIIDIFKIHMFSSKDSLKGFLYPGLTTHC